MLTVANSFVSKIIVSVTAQLIEVLFCLVDRDAKYKHVASGQFGC